MDPSSRAWRRPALAALAVAALLAVVALTSGSRPWSSGSHGTRHLPHGFWDAAWTVVFLLWLVAAGFAVRRAAFVRGQRKEVSWQDQLKALLVVLIVGLLIGGVYASHFLHRHAHQGHPGETQGAAGSPSRFPTFARHGVPYEPHFNLPAALLTIAVVVLVAAILVGRRRRRSRPLVGDRQSAAAALAQVLDDSLDDLRREPDARRAVIAAYARMERALGAYELGRHESEAPGEYLGRVLGELGASGESARRLTDLFARAKFSPHEIDSTMKNDAIDALVTLRDELRAAA